jgi:hypothetical protein
MEQDMTKDEALKLALEAFGEIDWSNNSQWQSDRAKVAIATLKKAMAQPEQEPVAWMHTKLDGVVVPHQPADLSRHPDRWEALYRTPPPCPTCEALARTVMLDQTYHDNISPQRTWVGLIPACPQGLTQYECELEGVDLVCFLEYTPDEEGSRDSRGLLDEPGTYENLELVNAYVKGTDIDIGHLLLQYLVDHITTTALEDYKNDDL